MEKKCVIGDSDIEELARECGKWKRKESLSQSKAVMEDGEERQIFEPV